MTTRVMLCFKIIPATLEMLDMVNAFTKDNNSILYISENCNIDDFKTHSCGGLSSQWNYQIIHWERFT